MCTNTWRSLLTILLWTSTACSQLLQETCVSIDGVALKGQEFNWIDTSFDTSGDSVDINSCYFTDTGTHFLSQEIPFSESPFVLNTTGRWNFECTDGDFNGSVSVVPGLHMILVTANVPQDCYAVGTDDVVLWLLDGPDNQTCEKSIIVENDAGVVVFTSNLTGKQSHYQFTRKGKYYLRVDNLPSVTHTIIVLERDIVNITNDYLQQQCVSVSSLGNSATVDCDECSFKNDVSEGLLFSHASIMSVSFGILFPVGALLAANGSPFAHKIIQPGAIILSLIGYGFVLAYIEVEKKNHFNTMHSFVGFFLVLLMVVMPFMRLRRELHYIHKKCGVIIVFYGMTNVLLGLVTVGCAPVYVKSVYGAWLILTIAFYVFWKNSKEHREQGVASSDEGWNGCCFQPRQKSINLEIPIRIRRLSRNVIDEDKFVAVRDISEEGLQRLAVAADSRPTAPTITSSERPPVSALPHHVVSRSDSLRVTRHSERAKDYDPVTGTFKGTTPSPNLITTEAVTTFDHLPEHSDEEDYSEELMDKFVESNDNVFTEPPVKMRNGGTVGSTDRRKSSSRTRTRANTLPVDFEQSWELHTHRRFNSLSSNGEAILCADRKGNITYWGDGAVKMFGYTPNEALGCSLKMLMPSEYQERHQNGLDRNTQSTIKYLRKHQYAPEFQKHARLYEVKALSKNGEKFPVEVNLASFVVDEEIYYAAILRDMSVPRKVSASSTGRHIGDKELRIKKKALLVGATMKFTHKLTSPEYITKEELHKVMSDSLSTAHVETGPEQIDEMINNIVKAGDRSDNVDSISYLDLLKILSQHGLHVKESGLIGRHSKQNRKTIQLNRTKRLKQYFVQNCVPICWLLGYFILNVLLYLVVSLSSDSEGWRHWAVGSNTVLCMNFLLIILPVLRSILDSLHSHSWLSKVLPLNHRTTFHLLIIFGIFFWCSVHVVLHLCSYAMDDYDDENMNSTSEITDNVERLRNKLEDNPQFLITGGLIVLFLLAMMVTSIKKLQVSFNFILFYTIHFISSGSIYLLIFIHGSSYVNSQFWKWLIPIVILWIFEWLYRRYSNRVQKVNILEAHTTCNMVIYKVAKPSLFKFVPGQFISVKFPNISPISWNHCEILSAPSDKFLSFVVEKKGSWGNKIYKTIFVEPYNAPVLLGDEHYAKAYLSGPYGEMKDILFDYKCSLLVCEDEGLFAAHSILRQFTQHIITHKGNICKCGCAPSVTKLLFIWVSRNRNSDHQWFVDFLTEIIEGGAMPTMVDARVYFTDSDMAPDDLAALMLNLGLAMSDVQPKSQLKRKASTGSSIKPISVDGIPDFEYILQGIQAQNLAWEVGVFSLGNLHATLLKDLKDTCRSLSESAQSTFEFHQIVINK